MFTLLKSVREYKWVSIITPILKIAEVIMEVLIPLYMADLIDYGIDKGDYSNTTDNRCNQYSERLSNVIGYSGACAYNVYSSYCSFIYN